MIQGFSCSCFYSLALPVNRMLSRKDIEVIVEKGMPFLFKNGDDSGRRMRSFLGSGHSNVSLCH